MTRVAPRQQTRKTTRSLDSGNHQFLVGPETKDTNETKACSGGGLFIASSEEWNASRLAFRPSDGTSKIQTALTLGHSGWAKWVLTTPWGFPELLSYIDIEVFLTAGFVP